MPYITFFLMTILSFKGVWNKKESSWFAIIKEYMRLLEMEDTENLNKFIFDFKEKYTNKKLDKEFYQRLIAKMDNIELLKNLY